MSDEARPGALVALRDARERTIQQLSDAFAGDELELEEFERRLTIAHRAATVAELTPLVADLASWAAPRSSCRRTLPSR